MILNVDSLLTIKELSDRLGVDEKTVYWWRKNGINGRKLPIRRVGHRVYFDHAEVLAFLGWENRDVNSNSQS